jgi:hypothetical protein
MRNKRDDIEWREKKKERRTVIRIERQGERGELRGWKRQEDRQKIKLIETNRKAERRREIKNQ